MTRVVLAIFSSLVSVDASSDSVAGVGFVDRVVTHRQNLANLAVAETIAVAKFQNFFHVQVLDLLVDSGLLALFLELALFRRRLLTLFKGVVERLDIVLQRLTLLCQLFV